VTTTRSSIDEDLSHRSNWLRAAVLGANDGIGTLVGNVE
jgi:VIT1/CCC1 family predicted Fe2+/Mn2+ transporter